MIGSHFSFNASTYHVPVVLLRRTAKKSLRSLVLSALWSSQRKQESQTQHNPKSRRRSFHNFATRAPEEVPISTASQTNRTVHQFLFLQEVPVTDNEHPPTVCFWLWIFDLSSQSSHYGPTHGWENSNARIGAQC